MASVLDYCKCELCGGLVYDDYYCNTGESYIMCVKCGYMNNTTIKRDDEGNAIIGEDGRPEWKKVTISNPCGAYRLTPKEIDGKPAKGSQIGSLGENIKKEDILKMFDLDKIAPEESYITYRNPETGEVEVIFGQAIPDTYEE